MFPGTGLMCLVWETFAMVHSMYFEDLPVTFQDVKFLRATSLMKNKDVILTISIHKGEFRFGLNTFERFRIKFISQQVLVCLRSLKDFQ